MKNYKLWNNVTGWLVCGIASLVYLLTAEPTTSWWDCGEYISTAYKLQVGHPPGAPTFQLIGRLASMFAGGDVMKVAYTINAMSAICSGLTILFLFWTITMFAKKVVVKNGNEMSLSQAIAVLGSGLVGALAYTFSDTFWFSAVEGEVYAMSSFFTAIVFWAILKWEAQADQKHSLRWLILISFLVGLAIGVHLLNLLTIPAIVYVYYFKKYPKTSKKGMFWAFLISIVLVVLILYVIVPYFVILAGAFEVFAVNSLGLPFNSGTIIYFLLLFGAIIGGIVWSHKKERPVTNAAILSVLFIIIGYSSFFLLIIRANANTPINENAPKDAVSMRAYLGREQYGERPLFYGEYYGAQPVDYKEGYQKYVKGEHRYEEAGKGISYVYDDKDCMLFPRMYSPSEDRNHPVYYKWWSGIKTDRKPTFAENIGFFVKYQLNYMYWRYFMWNFAGRQNDIQGEHFNHDGTRNYTDGHWITGIKFIDEMRLGPQDNLPDDLASNKAHNKLYALPLILGLVGLFFHFKRDKKDTFIVLLLFFMTGLAIIIYLNQPPIEPRERDYAYAGSFYAFAIWIGLGVLALYEWISKKLPHLPTAIATTVLCLALVPCIMAKEEWDDHDRSKKYAARDFSFNFLNSCDKNAILMTYGDNDTFPLWYLQEVEDQRTDVRILNYTLSGMSWYVEQLYNTLYDSKSLPFTLPKEFYGMSKDYIFVEERAQTFELKEMLQLMKDGNPRFKAMLQNGTEANLLPTNRFKMTLDIPKLVEKGVIPANIADSISPEITWEIKKNRLFRNELMFLDILVSNGFERPIYVMNPYYLRDVFPQINEYIQKEGFIYRLMPYKVRSASNLDKSFEVANNAVWGNLNDPEVYIDPISNNQSSMIRYQYAMLGQELIDAGRTDQAKIILDKGCFYFPDFNFQYDQSSFPYVAGYANIGEKQKALEILTEIVSLYEQKMRYYNQFRGSKASGFRMAKEEAMQVLQVAYNNAQLYEFKDLQKRIEPMLQQAQF